MTLVTLSLPDDTVRRIDDAAAAFLRSRSNLVRAVLEQWLSHPHTALIARETLARLDLPPPEAPHERV